MLNDRWTELADVKDELAERDWFMEQAETLQSK